MAFASLPDLTAVAGRHNLSVVTIKDLIAYRMRHERLVERVEEVGLPTQYGEFRAVIYRNRTSGRLHFALVAGDVETDEPVLVRVQPSHGIMDIFNLLRSDCTDRFRNALSAIQKEGRGALVFLHPDSMSEEVPHPRREPLPSDEKKEAPQQGPTSRLREYGIGAQILADLGMTRIRIMTNEAWRLVALEGYGLQLEERVPVELETPLPAVRPADGK